MCIDSSETIVLNKYVTWKSEKKKQKKKNQFSLAILLLLSSLFLLLPIELLLLYVCFNRVSSAMSNEHCLTVVVQFSSVQFDFYCSCRTRSKKSQSSRHDSPCYLIVHALERNSRVDHSFISSKEQKQTWRRHSRRRVERSR